MALGLENIICIEAEFNFKRGILWDEVYAYLKTRMEYVAKVDGVHDLESGRFSVRACGLKVIEKVVDKSS